MDLSNCMSNYWHYNKKYLKNAFIVIGLLVFVINSVFIINEAKALEQTKYKIEYSYDNYNNSDTSIYEVPLKVTENEASSVELNDGIYHIEFDRLFFGTLKIDFREKLQSECNVNIVIGENKNSNGAVWTRNDMNEQLTGYGLNYYEEDVVIPAGVKSYLVKLPLRTRPSVDNIKLAYQNWEGGVFPFKYCDIKGLPYDNMNCGNFIQCAVTDESDYSVNTFVSDNEILNQVYALCKDTIEATTYSGIYVDGYRELKTYEADSYINELGHMSLTNNYNIDRQSIELLLKNHTWPTEWIELTIPLVYEYYMYSGDKEFLENHWEEVEECILSELENEEGLIDSNLITSKTLNKYGVVAIRDIIDWPVCERDNFASHYEGEFKLIIKDYITGYYSIYKSLLCDLCGYNYASAWYKINGEGLLESHKVIDSPNSVVNAFYYRDLLELSYLANELNNYKDSEYYGQKAALLKTQYQRKFINNNTGLVKDTINKNHSSLHANIVALDFGLVPRENETRVINFIKSKGMNCSVYMSQYLLEALFKYGEAEYAIELMTNKSETSWYNMILNGASLTTEAWSEDIKLDMDWNHAWATAPANVITRKLVGVQPYTPGYEIVSYTPNFGNLRRCKAVIPIKGGEFSVNYVEQDGTQKYIITADRDVVFYPPDYMKSVLIDGNIVKLEHGKYIKIEKGKHIIIIE